MIKYKLIERYRAKHDLPLSSPRVAQLDLAYHDIHRDRGLYYLLERTRRGRAGRAATWTIFEAKSVPPQTTRARLRGEFIRRAQERRRDFTVDWVHLKLNDQAQRTVLCKDPFRSRRRAGREAHRQHVNPLRTRLAVRHARQAGSRLADVARHLPPRPRIVRAPHSPPSLSCPRCSRLGADVAGCDAGLDSTADERARPRSRGRLRRQAEGHRRPEGEARQGADRRGPRRGRRARGRQG